MAAHRAPRRSKAWTVALTTVLLALTCAGASAYQLFNG